MDLNTVKDWKLVWRREAKIGSVGAAFLMLYLKLNEMQIARPNLKSIGIEAIRTLQLEC